MEESRNVAENVPEIEDSMVVAYLFERGHRYEAIVKENGMIAFRVYGDIDSHLREFYEGYKMNVNDYIRCLKHVRASMFSKKDEQKISKRRNYESQR